MTKCTRTFRRAEALRTTAIGYQQQFGATANVFADDSSKKTGRGKESGDGADCGPTFCGRRVCVCV